MAQATLLKKTTIYLSEDDLLRLRKMANLKNITVAEAIRFSIKETCKPKDKEEKSIWSALDRIWAKTHSVGSEKIERAVDRAVNEVRGGKKTRRRR